LPEVEDTEADEPHRKEPADQPSEVSVYFRQDAS
jgi:hypothetical protein